MVVGKEMERQQQGQQQYPAGAGGGLGRPPPRYGYQHGGVQQQHIGSQQQQKMTMMNLQQQQQQQMGHHTGAPQQNPPQQSERTQNNGMTESKYPSGMFVPVRSEGHVALHGKIQGNYGRPQGSAFVQQMQPQSGGGMAPPVRRQQQPMGVAPRPVMQPHVPRPAIFAQPQYQQRPSPVQEQHQQRQGPPGMAPVPQGTPAVGQQQHMHGPPPSTGYAVPAGPSPSAATVQQQSQEQYPRPPAFGAVSPSKPTPIQTAVSSGGAGNKSIDPAQMPRPSSSTLPTQVFETRREGTHSIPPPTDVPIAVRDTGNSGPRYMRSSMNSIPMGSDVAKSSSLPLIVLVQPFALPGKNDSAIPLIDYRPEGPLRCSGCKAYVCPFMKWSTDGQNMMCCFCGASTKVPSIHFGHVSIDGKRSDVDSRPELAFGTVEYVVDGPYQIREPMLPTFLFLIDCTEEAVRTGATATVCSSLMSLLDSIAGSDRARVALVTFDSSVHFYQLQKRGSNDGIKMVVMPDAEEPFSPLGSDCFVDVATHGGIVKQLLQKIPNIFASAAGAESAGGSALSAATDALALNGGGRLICFISSLPHKGALGLRPREAGKPPSERDALDVLTVAGNGKKYESMAKVAAQNQISIDIFALTQGYVDLATLSILSKSTSGSVYRYSPFSLKADSVRFYDDLRWNLSRHQGLEAVGRMRVSSGLAVDDYLGSFWKHGLQELQFPVITCDSTIAVKILHEERLKEGSNACFQFAVLYSTTSGQRRVRVISQAIPVTRSLGSVFRGADLEVYLGFLARQVISMLPGKSISSCKDFIVKTTVETLLAYRKHCASSSSSGQLILPESLKLVPLFTLGLLKLPCFRVDARADSRAVWMSRILSLPIDRLLPAVHPRFVKIPVPPPDIDSISAVDKLPITAEKLESGGIYILENGYDMFLMIGKDVPTNTLESLLGVDSLESIDPATFGDLPERDTPLSAQTRKFVGEMRRQRRSFMHMRLVRKSHPHETLFLSSLVEDRHPFAGMSYVEYLCHLHRQIQNKMA